MKTQLLLLLLLTGPASGQSSLSQLMTLSGSDSALSEALIKDIDNGLKKKVEKDAAARTLLTVTQKKGEDGKISRLLVIHTAQLGKPYLFTSNIERGTSDGSVLSSMMDETFLCVFKRSGDKLIFARRQTAYRAPRGSAESRAIDQSVADQILAVLPIVAVDPDNSYVTVPANALFLSDPTRMGYGMKRMNGPQRQVQYKPDASSLVKLAAFPKNVEAASHLVFSMANPDDLVSITMRYSITDLPENKGFEPRPADPRVGYFTTSYQDLARPDLKHKIAPVEHLINRWDLRKKVPDAAVSEVVKPVTFWLEDTIPEEYRPAIKAGILSWNKAFEAAGLKGAIEVKEVDKDMSFEEWDAFDPANISYNMVRWFVGDGSSFAIGPSRVNPLTGEILNASVSVGDMITRFVSGDLVLAAGQDGPGAHKHSAACRHGDAMREASASLNLLKGQNASPADIERYQYEFIAGLMAHEIGHNLGLRHNFKASNAAAKNGYELHSTSVMDYLPAKLAGRGERQGAYYQTEVGAYDKWAIEYGYASLAGDEKEALQQIAGRSGSDPLLAYATDEDADRLDPDAQRWDAGADPVAYAQDRLGLVKDLIKSLEDDASAPGHDPAQLKEKFSAGFSAYWGATRQVLPLVGGVRAQRGPGARFKPVTAAEQREAIKFLEKEVFAKDAMKVSPNLLLSMGADQTSFAMNSPMSPTSMISSVQDLALRKLYSPATLKRLSDGELYVTEAGGSLTVGEMLQRVRAAVWSETLSPKAPESIGLSRRNLQASHLKILIDTAGSSPVIDAKAAARRDLERVKRDLTRAIPLSKDEASKLHMREMLRQAEEALETKD